MVLKKENISPRLIALATGRKIKQKHSDKWMVLVNGLRLHYVVDGVIDKKTPVIPSDAMSILICSVPFDIEAPHDAPTS